jgi:hypothetical protein
MRWQPSWMSSVWIMFQAGQSWRHLVSTDASVSGKQVHDGVVKRIGAMHVITGCLTKLHLLFPLQGKQYCTIG